jgi:hypothetical protein
LCDFFSKDVIHHHLKGCGGVNKAKEHDYWFEKAFTCLEGGFSLIPLLDLNIIVAPPYVKF